ncbi:hypothetical protein H310_10256 [Aphanomyces invadans]|uniref:Tc1-like transposase DDE domain-containing protein n=1 Tax=Aphanomyces invadans TaxID=157072 RepID=A0A024TQW7_9STRA|nr:hypothetical protein H310_10256 [Aphanomyces invadans]ETV96545.1 hypothetical protein H310_10256 [Aphanomyces invadans]|eukprot:XP_008874808.1 hypothetical protein H310_10256 [Aphanomyces invadans]
MGAKNLTDVEREAVLREVFLKSNARAKKQGVADGNMSASVASKKKGRVGRKKAYTTEQVKTKLLEVPLEDRTSLRSIAEKTGIKLATLHRYLRLGMFRAHSSSIRPMLTDANKYARLKYAANKVGPDMMMDAMLDCVHLDEKWFYITRETRKFYLVPGEKGPDRKCKNKRFITKVMFLSAVARPRYVDETDQWWDGKIGTWPFTAVVPAMRTSVNRVAGSLETKSINVTKDVYRSFLVDRVLPAIVSKWPGPPSVRLQHDNARAHVTSCDAALCRVFDSYAVQGWQFELVAQPPNSPDTNVLDLGFFAAIQSLQHRKSARTIDQLVSNVVRAFDEYPLEGLERTFLTLQACLIEVLRDGGDNTFKIPHQSKDKLARKGRLPLNATCPMDVYETAKLKLRSSDAAAMERKMADEVCEAREA